METRHLADTGGGAVCATRSCSSSRSYPACAAYPGQAQALMPIRICMEPRCPNEAAYRGRCRAHATRRNRETRSANKNPVYNKKRWAILRSRYLFAHPLCECGCGHISEDVHHRRAIRDGGDPWAWDNLEALTHACHSKATRREQVGATT